MSEAREEERYDRGSVCAQSHGKRAEQRRHWTFIMPPSWPFSPVRRQSVCLSGATIEQAHRLVTTAESLSSLSLLLLFLGESSWIDIDRRRLGGRLRRRRRSGRTHSPLARCRFALLTPLAFAQRNVQLINSLYNLSTCTHSRERESRGERTLFGLAAAFAVAAVPNRFSLSDFFSSPPSTVFSSAAAVVPNLSARFFRLSSSSSTLVAAGFSVVVSGTAVAVAGVDAAGAGVGAVAVVVAG